MLKEQKLKLTWIGKENRSKLKPRIPLEDLTRPYRERHRVTDQDMFDDRIGFTNPGSLLPGKTVDRLIGATLESRNEILAAAFRRYRICVSAVLGLDACLPGKRYTLKRTDKSDSFCLPRKRWRKNESDTEVLKSPMTKKQKLALTWIGKNARPKQEPRIMLEAPVMPVFQ